MSKIKVLIADDVAQTRKELRRLLLLEEDMAVVAEAANGAEAVELAQQLAPDVILMDVNMPVMDGIRATELIVLKVPQVAIVIVSIQGEAEYLRKAMMAGARDFLVKPISSGELVNAIRTVYQAEANRREAREKLVSGPLPFNRGNMVVVFSPKGGVGKTTISTNLGIALSQKKAGRVGLVDLDLQFGDVGLVLNMESRRNLSHLLREENIDTETVESYLVPHFSGLRVMMGPGQPQAAEAITPEGIKSVISVVRQCVDWLIVDTAPGLNEICLDMLAASDHILLLVTPDIAAVKSVRLCIQLLDSMGLSGKALVVLNRAGVKLGLKAADVEKGLGRRPWGQVPKDDAVVVDAVNRGIPFVLSHGNTSISQSIRELAQMMVNLNAPQGVESTAGLGVANRLIKEY